VTTAVASPIRSSSYTPALIALHWITVLVIATAFAAIELRGYYPRGSETRDFLIATHKSCGMLVLMLVVVRIGVAARNAAPPIVPAPPGWQMLAARLVHLTLYAAMIAMPLLGWTMTSAGAHPIPFFGLTIPPIIGPDKDLSKTLTGIHEFIGNALYYIIAIHAAGALVHHYLLKDNTLVRMLRPGR
jgi:superoxide oxidase